MHIHSIKALAAGAAVAAAAVALPLAGATAIAAPSTAATSSITCTVLKGTVNTSTGEVSQSFMHCSGNTGTTGHQAGKDSAPKATVHWKNADTTTFTATDSSGSFTCPSGDIAEAVTGKVTADTTGSATVGGAVSESVCYNPSTSTFVNAAGTKVKI